MNALIYKGTFANKGFENKKLTLLGVNFGQHVLTIFGLAQAVGKNSSKNGKLGNCWLKVRGVLPLGGLGI